MKKKELIIIITICITLSIIVGAILSIDSKAKKDLESYDVKDANMSCYYEGESTDDSGNVTGKYYNYMYIYNDTNEYVTKVIYKSVYTNSYFNESLKDLTESILELYTSVDGITSNIDVVNNKTVVTIEFDYTKINLEEAREELEDILSSEAVLMNMEERTTVEEFLKIEDPDYICK